MKPFNEEGAFESPVHDAGIKRLAVRGAGVTILSSGLGLAVQIVSTVALARLLTPADFGVVTMVTTFSLLLVNFGINGFTEAILQREKLDCYLASNLFWINLGIGTVLTIGFAATGTLLARFYHNPLVSSVAASVSLTILATSLSVIHLALLKRAMRFPLVSAITIIAQAVSIAVSIFLALHHWGYKALVAGVITQAAVQSICAWSFCRWVPRLPRRAPGTGSMVRFAMHVYGRFTFNYFSRNVDNLLVGWRYGAIPLGYYKKAYDLFALSASQLTAPLANVAVSALSRFKPDSEQYRKLLLNALGVIAFAGMGLSGEFSLIGKDLIRLLLGPGWEQAGWIFTFFGPGIGVMMVYYAHSWIHLSIGRPDRWLRWGIVEVGVTFVLFLALLPWGPAAIAVAWTLSYWVLVIPAFWYAGNPIQFGVAPVIAVVWRYIVAAAAAGYASFLIAQKISIPAGYSGSMESLMRILVVTIIYAVLYLAAVVLLYQGFDPVKQVGRLLREMIARKASPATS